MGNVQSIYCLIVNDLSQKISKYREREVNYRDFDTTRVHNSRNKFQRGNRDEIASDR